MKYLSDDPFQAQGLAEVVLEAPASLRCLGLA